MLQQALINLNHDIALVQRYIINSQNAGFNDMTRLLESMSIKLFEASHNLKLKNKNLLSPNFPAIDLADDEQKTAVQVTSNATSAKIKHTLKKFQEHGLAKSYDLLIIHGFVDQVKPRQLPSYCTLVSIGQIVSAVADKNNEELVQELADTIQQHTDYSRIHPYDDKNCLEITLRCIDRNAIKHRMSIEGPYKDFVKGLNEITELISKGTIGRKSKSKSVDDFQDQDIIAYLVKVRDLVGQIVGIMNKCRVQGSDFVDIPFQEYGRIDSLKIEIVLLSNAIAAKHGINMTIQTIGG